MFQCVQPGEPQPQGAAKEQRQRPQRLAETAAGLGAVRGDERAWVGAADEGGGLALACGGGGGGAAGSSRCGATAMEEQVRDGWRPVWLCSLLLRPLAGSLAAGSTLAT